MPYDFEVVGYEDFDGDRHRGQPSDTADVYGVLVHAYDPNNPEDQHYWWTFIPEPLDEWDDWYDLIDAISGQHGIELA